MNARDFLEALADAVTSKMSRKVSCKSSKSDAVVGNQCGDRQDEDTAAADVDPDETKSHTSIKLKDSTITNT